MRVLIACEESQTVCKEFRARGHEAFSCDIQECSGGRPEWHIRQNVLPILRGGYWFRTEDGERHEVESWDLIIAHPPCTYLSTVSNRHFVEATNGAKAAGRYFDRIDAIRFFMEFALCGAEKVAIENPVGIMSGVYRKPDQIIEPYEFGDPFEKRTCLWLRNLKPLEPTNIVEPEPRQVLSSGKTMPPWYSRTGKKNRSKDRSKTFPGIAKAMAEQWG